MPRPIHLQPTAELAERVLLPGDPGRALRLAQGLLEDPRMFNHARGLWGYTGRAADGHPLSIQSTGMGGPSAAIVVAELAELGARRLIRVGTCGALDRSLTLGELLIANQAMATDGTSRALGAGELAAPSPVLLASLVGAAGVAARSGRVLSADLFYDVPPGDEQRWGQRGALAVEMEAATLFTLAALRGVEAAAILIVSDLVLPERRRIETARLLEAELGAGELAARALARA